MTSRQSKKAQLFAILSEVRKEDREERWNTIVMMERKKPDGCKPASYMEKTYIK